MKYEFLCRTCAKDFEVQIGLLTYTRFGPPPCLLCSSVQVERVFRSAAFLRQKPLRSEPLPMSGTADSVVTGQRKMVGVYSSEGAKVHLQGVQFSGFGTALEVAADSKDNFVAGCSFGDNERAIAVFKGGNLDAGDLTIV